MADKAPKAHNLHPLLFKGHKTTDIITEDKSSLSEFSGCDCPPSHHSTKAMRFTVASQDRFDSDSTRVTFEDSHIDMLELKSSKTTQKKNSRFDDPYLDFSASGPAASMPKDTHFPNKHARPNSDSQAQHSPLSQFASSSLNLNIEIGDEGTSPPSQKPLLRQGQLCSCTALALDYG